MRFCDFTILSGFYYERFCCIELLIARPARLALFTRRLFVNLILKILGVIIVEIFRHAPNATPDGTSAALGASAGAAAAGPVEIFKHAPNGTPDAAGAASGVSAGQVVAGPTAEGAVRVSGCSRTQCHMPRLLILSPG